LRRKPNEADLFAAGPAEAPPPARQAPFIMGGA